MTKYDIQFITDNSRVANSYATELISFIKRESPNAKVERGKDDEDTLDIGAVVSVIAGSTALSAISKGIQAWITKRHDAKVTLKKDGSIIAENIRPDDAAELVKLLSK